MYTREDQIAVFKKNIEWFKANYGTEHYTKSKSDLIWEELKEFSPKQIDSVFHKMIGESEFAPKVGTFRTWASCLREKIRQFEREQDRNDAKDFWEGTFHSTEVHSMIETIKLRMQGKVTDDEWKQFKEMISKVGVEPKCKKCEDTLVYYDERMRPYKCHHLPEPLSKSWDKLL